MPLEQVDSTLDLEVGVFVVGSRPIKTPAAAPARNMRGGAAAGVLMGRDPTLD